MSKTERVAQEWQREVQVESTMKEPTSDGLRLAER